MTEQPQAVPDSRIEIIDVNGSVRKVFDVYINIDYPGYVEAVFRKHKEWYPIADFISRNPNIVLEQKDFGFTKDGKKKTK